MSYLVTDTLRAHGRNGLVDLTRVRPFCTDLTKKTIHAKKTSRVVVLSSVSISYVPPNIRCCFMSALGPIGATNQHSLESYRG